MLIFILKYKVFINLKIDVIDINWYFFKCIWEYVYWIKCGCFNNFLLIILLFLRYFDFNSEVKMGVKICYRILFRKFCFWELRRKSIIGIERFYSEKYLFRYY